MRCGRMISATAGSAYTGPDFTHAESMGTVALRKEGGAKMINDVLFSSVSDQWETPQDLFAALDAEFGFTLDPCADAENHKCEHYYTKEDDGLQQDWKGNVVFCNPPYGRNIAKWIEKAYNEGCKKDTVVVMLLPARTDTKYFHDYVLHRAEVRFIRGRLKFGGSKNGAPFPSMLVIYRGPGM